MSKKSNFRFGPIIILILIIVHLVRQGHISDWLNKKNKSNFEFQLCMNETNDVFKCKNPLIRKFNIEQLKKYKPTELAPGVKKKICQCGLNLW